MVQGDTEPLVTTLTDARGPIDLTGCTAWFRMKSLVAGGHPPIFAACGIMQQVDGSGKITNKGKVSYTWATGETDVVGVYGLQWVVTFTNGKKRTFPNKRMKTWNIEPAAA